MVKAIVTGVAGRMGGRIVHMMEAAAGIRLVGALESPGHTGGGQRCGRGRGVALHGGQGGGLPGPGLVPG